jgi:hypothetical protein
MLPKVFLQQVTCQVLFFLYCLIDLHKRTQVTNLIYNMYILQKRVVSKLIMTHTLPLLLCKRQKTLNVVFAVKRDLSQSRSS